MAHVVCCIYCGRDTRSRSGICRRCLGADVSQSVDRSGRGPEDEVPLEDDFSEESGPDSVVQDWDE